MKKYFWSIISLLIAAGIQGNLPSSITILGAKPDLILVVLIVYSLAEEPSFGATLGFIAGLINGSAVGCSLGSFIVTRTITGFLAGLTTSQLFSENPIVPVLSATWLTLVCEGVFLLGNPRPDIAVVTRGVLGKCIYNAFFTLLLYLAMRNFAINKKIRMANSRI